MDICSDDEFITKLTNYLNEQKIAELTKLFMDQKYVRYINNTINSTISILSSYLTAKTEKTNYELVECIEMICNVISTNFDQMDVILGILQQLENEDSNTKYCILLKPLSLCYDRDHDKMGQFLEWTISTIKSYISSITDSYLISDSNQILSVYNPTIDFLQNLYNKSHVPKDLMKKYFLSTLIYLFGRPFCFVDEKVWMRKDFLLLLNKMLDIVFQLCSDILELFYIIELRSKNQVKTYSANNLFESEEQIPSLAFSHLYSIIFINNSLHSRIPLVYNPNYILHNSLYLVCILMNKSNYPIFLLSKGLNFIKIVLSKINKYSIPTNVLQYKHYLDFVGTITQIMIYCDSKENRMLAFNAFTMYIDIFTLQARYRIILHLYETANHSGFLSIVTNIFKNSIIECLDHKDKKKEFLGNNMIILLKQACKLKHGKMSDLIELADENISALNLLRFLFIRDQNNETGVWDYVLEIEKNYLTPLREGIELSRSHWQVKICDIKKQIKDKDNTSIDNIDINIGGNNLKILPLDQKLSVCINAINALDMMYSILIRINECVTLHNEKSYKN